MADTLQFDLVSPERRLASVQATEVQIPGADGDMTAMEGHAPTITTLRPGILKVIGVGWYQSLCGEGRLCRNLGQGVSVLAERAIPVEEVTGTVMDELMAEARSLAAAALPEDRDLAQKMIDDLEAMRAAAGH